MNGVTYATSGSSYTAPRLLGTKSCTGSCQITKASYTAIARGTARALLSANSVPSCDTPVQTHVLRAHDINASTYPMIGLRSRAVLPSAGPSAVGPFDFKTTPSLTAQTVSCPAYAADDKVDVFSVSEGTWINARVTHVDQHGTVTVNYGGKSKSIPSAELTNMVRGSARTLPEIVSDPRREGAGAEFAVGQSIQVFSDSKAAWVVAEVAAVRADGTISVKYSCGATKDVGPTFHRRYLKPCAETANMGGTTHEPPTVIGGYGEGGHALQKQDAKPKYSIGQPVQVFSESQSAWVTAKVTGVNFDGSVTVLYSSGASKEIAPLFFNQYLKQCPSYGDAISAAEPPTIIGGY